MIRTFEERVGQELDGLYQAALFLYAGDRDSAESHLLAALGRAFPDDPSVGPARAPEVDFAHWIEGRVVLDFFRQARSTPGTRPVSRAGVFPAGEHTLKGADVHAAAALVAPEARAVLWLVLIRRWAYADAAQALGIDTAQVRALLASRTDLIDGLASSAYAEDVRQKGHRSMQGGEAG